MPLERGSLEVEADCREFSVVEEETRVARQSVAGLWEERAGLH